MLIKRNIVLKINFKSLLLFLLVSFNLNTFYAQEKFVYKGKIKQDKEKLIKKTLPFEIENLGEANWQKVYENNGIQQNSEEIDVVISESKSVYSHNTKKINPYVVQLGTPSISKRLPFKIPDVRSISFKYLNTLCGLPSDNVISICDDDAGNMWIASDVGIYKISGFYVHYYDYKQNFPECSPEKIFSYNGKIYIATFGQGLFILNGSTVEIYNKENGFFSDHIIGFDRDSTGLYICYYGDGLIHHNDNQIYTQITFSDNTSSNIVVETRNSPLGRVFVSEKGIFGILNNSQKSFKIITSDEVAVGVKSKIAANSKQLYINIENKGILYYNEGQFKLISSSSIASVDQLYLAKSGALWIFSKNGLSSIRNDKIIQTYADESYFSKFHASAFFQDKYLNLWISSYNKGIGIITPSNFSQINVPKNLISKVKTIYIDKQKNKYIENSKGGIIKIDSTESYYTFSNTMISDISSINEFNGKIYIATLNGLYFIENNTLFKILIPKDKGFNTQLFILPTKEALYINNYNYGLLKYNEKEIVNFTNFSSLTYVSHIDKQGAIWIANDTKGISKITNDSVIHYSKEHGFGSNSVFCLASDFNNIIYAGTPKGLMAIKKDSTFIIPLPFQSSEKIINCVFNEQSKTLWVSNGVELFNLKINNTEYTITKYNRNEIIANGVIQKNTLICDGKDLFFGVGDQMVKYVDFKFGYQNKKIPIELIELKTRNTNNETEFKVENNSYYTNKNQKLVLAAGNYDINFSIDIKHWGKEEGLLFYYRILGWSNNWKGPIADNTIAFSNLTPGSYTLEIIGKSSDNVEIELLTFKFQIEQFYYQTTWFLLLCVGLILLLFYVLFKTYSSFDFRSFESYTSLNEVLIKIRLLAIFSIILFPAIEFYECVYLDLYTIEWESILLLIFLSIFTFSFTFNKRLNYNSSYLLLILVYISFYFINVLKGFRIGFPPSFSIELAIIILFSKLIFTELRTYFYFVLLSILTNVLCFFFYNVDDMSSINLNIYISASINSAIIIFVMYLVDYNSKRNVLFANKILESSDLFVLVCDEKGKVIFINDYLKRVTNKSENELLGFGWWEFRKYTKNEISDAIVKINSLIKLGQSDSYVNTLVLENQSLFIEWNEFVLDGKYLIGIGKDVTKEYTLNQQNERLSLVAKSVTNGVVITDASGFILWINESFGNLFDSVFDEVIGQNISELYCKGEVDNDTFQGNLYASFEFKFKSDNTISRWVLINTTPIFNAHKKITNYISVVTNISKQKKLENKLAEYADDLEINNLLKEQLIYSDSFEDIASASLITLKQKIQNIKMGSLILLNYNKSSFIGYYYQNDNVKKVVFAFDDIKGYNTLKNNSIFIEYDNRNHPENELSTSDLLRLNEDNIISYIELPIFYNNEFIGFVCLEFDCPFPMNVRQINLVKNFATLLSVAIHKIQIQQDLALKNKDITDSLYYAKSIQTSYFPQKEELNTMLKDFVLYYKPKDIVSGDFYWMEDLPNFSIIALGDCTGHGVPGAFITMLGHNLLTQITSELKMYSPSKMIAFLNDKIYLALNKNKDRYIKDGMELGICVYDKINNVLLYAGSGIELNYFQKNELKTIEVPRYMIGDNPEQLSMEDTTIHLDGTEKFYLSSDGYKDQLGGEPRKRYSKVKYLKLLNEIKNLPSFQQSFILNLNLQNHQGNQEQTDDILVIGFEL
jgi:PAS domain S-box-containing protein